MIDLEEAPVAAKYRCTLANALPQWAQRNADDKLRHSR